MLAVEVAVKVDQPCRSETAQGDKIDRAWHRTTGTALLGAPDTERNQTRYDGEEDKMQFTIGGKERDGRDEWSDRQTVCRTAQSTQLLPYTENEKPYKLLPTETDGIGHSLRLHRFDRSVRSEDTDKTSPVESSSLKCAH